MTRKMALITGATSGIGAAFAKKLSSQNYDLIITGRREEKIKKIAKELMALHHNNIEIMLLELADKHDLDTLIHKVKTIKNLDILINNAGFGFLKKFIDVDPEIYADMLTVHNHATLRLMHAALKNMLVNNHGTIINVSSITAFTTMPNVASYSATKAFLNAITYSIAKEIKHSKIKLQVLCPGSTETDLLTRHGQTTNEVAQKRGWLFSLMNPEKVVESSLRALKKNKVICIPGIRNKILARIGTLKRLLAL